MRWKAVDRFTPFIWSTYLEATARTYIERWLGPHHEVTKAWLKRPHALSTPGLQSATLVFGGRGREQLLIDALLDREFCRSLLPVRGWAGWADGGWVGVGSP